MNRWFTNKLLYLGLAPVAVYVLLAPQVAWPLYNWLLFQPGHHLGSEEPWKKIEQDFGISRKEVSFLSTDGVRIHGWFFRMPGTKRVFLVSQGKGGSLYNRSGMARMLLRLNGSVLLYNYRGYGQSEGVPSLDGVCKDAVAAYDYLERAEHAEGCDIIAYGESFGTGVTGQLVAQRKVGGVILQSGFSSLLRASRDLFPWLHLYPDFCFPKQTMDNLAVFGSAHPPLLIVHGQKDQMLAVRNAQDLYTAAVQPKTLLILPNGDHGTFGSGDEYFVAARKFLNDNSL